MKVDIKYDEHGDKYYGERLFFKENDDGSFSIIMSRTYDLELSCGCLIGTENNIYMPCLTANCKANEEYFDKYVDEVTRAARMVKK